MLDRVDRRGGKIQGETDKNTQQTSILSWRYIINLTDKWLKFLSRQVKKLAQENFERQGNYQKLSLHTPLQISPSQINEAIKVLFPSIENQFWFSKNKNSITGKLKLSRNF